MAPEPRHTALRGISVPDVGPLHLSPSSKWSLLCRYPADPDFTLLCILSPLSPAPQKSVQGSPFSFLVSFFFTSRQ